MIFLEILLGSSLLASLLVFFRTNDSLARRLIDSSFIVGTASFLVFWGLTVYSGVTFDWSYVRILPSFALIRGFDIYPGLHSAPILGWIYGPVGPLIYLLVTPFFKEPVSAVLAGGILTSLITFAPVYLILRANFQGKDVWVAIVCFGQLALQLFPLKLAVTTVHADAPALSFGALAIYFIQKHSRKALFWSSLCACLALFSKQVMLPLFPFLFIYLWTARGRRDALSFAVSSIFIFSIFSVIFSFFFGPSALWLNLVTIPTRTPWMEIASPLVSQFSQTFIYRVKLIFVEAKRHVEVNLFLFAIIGAVLSQSLRLSKIMLSRDPGFLWLVFGLVMFLPCVAARVRLGGFENSYAFTYYFLCIGLLLSLGQSDKPFSKLGKYAQVFILLIFPSFRLGLFLTSQNIDLKLIPNQISYEYLLKNPDGGYFPWHPLAALLANNKLYDFEYGVYDRRLSEVSPEKSELASRLKPVSNRIFILNSREIGSQNGKESQLKCEKHWPIFSLPSTYRNVGEFNSIWQMCELEKL